MEKGYLKLRFVNKQQHEQLRFNTHRGSLLSLAPRESTDVDFGTQKNIERAIEYYGRFKKNLEVIWLNKPQADKSIQEDEQQPLEPQDEGQNEEDIDDSEEESEDEESEDEGVPEFSREELEEMKYPKLIKIAKNHGITSKKKDEIIDALLGE